LITKVYFKIKDPTPNIRVTIVKATEIQALKGRFGGFRMFALSIT